MLQQVCAQGSTHGLGDFREMVPIGESTQPDKLRFQSPKTFWGGEAFPFSFSKKEYSIYALQNNLYALIFSYTQETIHKTGNAENFKFVILYKTYI